ncbi:MAG TPA: helix-turn-helix domain-containing protein [Actinocatenispora sp.]
MDIWAAPARCPPARAEAKEFLDISVFQKYLWDMEIGAPKAIRALAHPLRLDLLDLLAAIGPSTAARCGRMLEVPQANCSFHLRQLARYGFVEEAEPSGDRRERVWRIPTPSPTVRVTGDSDKVAARQLERVVVEREVRAILDHADRRDDEPTDWQHGPGIVTAVVPMSAADAAELEDKWTQLLAPYIARAEAAGHRLQPGQRRVRYFMAATPMADLAPEDDDDIDH